MSINDVVEMAKANGYKAYGVKGYDTWKYLITPKGNILCIQKATWGDHGFTFALEYKANAKCGRGCSCHESTFENDWGITSVTLEELEEYETSGYNYATRLKAPLYNGFDEWYDDINNHGVWAGMLEEA